MKLSKDILLENKDAFIRSNLGFLKGQSSKVKIFAEKGLASLTPIETSAKARSDVVEQSRILCEDYIYNRLANILHMQQERYFFQQTMGCDRQLHSQTSSSSTDSPTESHVKHAFFRSLGRLVSLSSESQVAEVFVQSSPDKVGQIRFEKWHNRLTDVSAEILSLGQRLEHFYPLLYDHLAAQLKMPLRSEIAITKAMTCIGDYMFRNNYVTWYRIVAMFAVAGAMSIEAVENHRGSLITSIVHVFSQIIERHAALWICKQGGWVSLIQEYEPTNESYRLLATVFGFIVGFFIVWIMPFRFFCSDIPFI